MTKKRQLPFVPMLLITSIILAPVMIRYPGLYEVVLKWHEIRVKVDGRPVSSSAPATSKTD